jgi:outer membrane protein OmpA-like peptidoglycan-associated protein
MSHHFAATYALKHSRGAACAAAALALFVGTLTATAAFADEVKSAEEIVTALSPRPAGANEATAGKGHKLHLRGFGVRPKVPTPPRIRTIDLSVHFRTDSAAIEERSWAQIAEIAAALHRLDLANAQLWIIGHTDTRGTEEYNRALSLRRARAVLQALVAGYGIPRGRLVAEGKGETEPAVSPERTPEDYAKNRRVELQLVPTQNVP